MIPVMIRGAPKFRPPVVTAAIIFTCVLVFGHEMTHGISRTAQLYGFRLDLLGKEPWRLITHMFVHGSFWHLFGNMVYLAFFGYHAECVYGHVKTVLLYFISGIAAALIFSLFHPVRAPLVGASGAISGILGFCVPFASELESLILWGFIVIPAAGITFLLTWFVIQLFLSTCVQHSYIAYTAHIAGFAVGTLAGLFMDGRNLYDRLLYGEHLEVQGDLKTLMGIFDGKLPDVNWDEYTDSYGLVRMKVEVEKEGGGKIVYHIQFPRELLDNPHLLSEGRDIGIIDKGKLHKHEPPLS